MRKLLLTFFCCLQLLALLPFHSVLACGPHTPIYTHFVYMFAHANLLHWLVNSWALLVLHNLIRTHRIIFAYLASVAISFIHTDSSLFTLNSSLILGLSVITTFLIGFAFLYLWRTNRFGAMATLFLLAIGLFLPHIAGWQHIVMFCLGIIYYRTETLIRSISLFMSH